MPVDERRRTALHRAISGSWGEEAADTLFELVTPSEPPATARGLDELRIATEQRFDAVDRRFDAVDQRFDALAHQLESTEHRLSAAFERRLADTFTSQTRTLVFSQLGALVAIAALAFGLR